MIAATFPTPARQNMADQFWPMAGVSVALCAIALAGMAVDVRLLDDVGVWDKPLKFAMSFAMYFATLALVVDRLGDRARHSRTVQIAGGSAIIAMVAELVYIFVMAGQGQRSHFNTSTPIYQVLYAAMGVGALTLVLAVATIGVVAWRDREAHLGPGLRLGILVGFVGSTVLTLITAGALSANNGHFVGVPGAGAAVLPLFGWSAAVGDLRPAHFLALHAMQAVPVMGWLADWRGLSARLVLPGALIYAALVLAVFAQALMGLPLIRL